MDHEFGGFGAMSIAGAPSGPRFVWQPYEELRHCYQGPTLDDDVLATALCGKEIITGQSTKAQRIWATCLECHEAARELRDQEEEAELSQISTSRKRGSAGKRFDQLIK